ncbi:MAG: hypothetical protein Q4D62_13670 [Planctomycetia bacterium]|nr:hypothetical protein [Planctomycetia bacterium]
MISARNYYGTVYTNAGAVLMARVVGFSSEVLTRSQLLSGEYSIFRMDQREENQKIPVPGMTELALDLDKVFLNTLRKDSAWTLDEKGYNFRHILNVPEETFSEKSRFYQVEYTFFLVDTTYPPIRIQFRLFTV